MDPIAGIERFEAPADGVVLTIGNFDGVHLGHQALLEAACEIARQPSVPVVVITFDPHPLAILAPERAPARLTTLEERTTLLAAHGADHVIVLRSDRDLLSKTAEQFLKDVVTRCRPRDFVEGGSFRFGRDRAGSIETLRERGDEFGYSVHVVAARKCESLPGAPTAASSAIRRALADGRVDLAHAMLGRPYRIAGSVGRGSGRGRPLGFPTANLESVPHLLPRAAVYAAAAQLESGAFHLAAVNIGLQPTFGEDTRPRVEAHLLDFDANLRERRLGIHLFARLRDQVKFAGPNELADQLRRDVAAARNYAGLLEELRSAPHVPL